MKGNLWEKTSEEGKESLQDEFIIEKIKERPINKKRLLKRTILTATMAVIFGLIACFTFLLLEPIISKILYPEEKAQVVVFPEDDEEMSPEEMLSDYMQQESQSSQTQEPATGGELSMEQIKEMIRGITLGRENYKQLYYAMSYYVKGLNETMVTITGLTSNVDWFNNVEESKHQSFGVIVAENGKELLILADCEPIMDAESLTMTFYNNVSVDAKIKEVDKDTHLGVIAVDLQVLAENMPLEKISIAKLGTSNTQAIVGTPVVALGNPMGTGGSLGYGMVTAMIIQQDVADTEYKFLQTDIVGSQNGGGVLFNLDGEVIGMITDHRPNTDMKSMITAYGISELKKPVEKMSNGVKMASLGICGVNVFRELNRELGVPLGAYITKVEMDSPSMQAGIQQGDVLVSINEISISGYSEYTKALVHLEPGQTVKIVVKRQAPGGYKDMKFEVELGER